MRTCELDALILDFGGVMAEEGFADGIRAIAKAAGLDQEKTWRVGLDTVWDSGWVFGRGQESDFWKMFKDRTGIQGDERRWSADIVKLFVVRPWMRRVTERFKDMGLITAILSDQTDWLARIDEQQSFSRHFDRVFNSFHHGMSKREPDFFLFALRELGVEAERTLFVDDNQGNVERARALGMHAFLYTDRAGFERDMRALCPAALDEKDSI